jgi:formate dehydrogenase major subunit
MSDPNLHHARTGLQRLEHLVVQEIFPTETALYADVVLPASALFEKSGTVTNTDRRVQFLRPALEPPGEARQDLWIVQELARRLGLDWQYEGPREVFAELRTVMPSIAGITWERLEESDSVTYPCRHEGDPGDGVVFQSDFPTADGRAQLSPATYAHGPELPDNDYPLVLITGRQLEHWHTGAMTRRATVLDAIEPLPTVSLHPESLARFGLNAGDAITVESHHGTVTAYARADDALMPGQLFLPFAYREAAANLLTGDTLDPYGKIPGFKFTAAAVRIRAAAPAETTHLTMN